MGGMPSHGRSGGGPAGRWTYLALGAILFLAMAVRLLPLVHFSVWGSDWGEYYSISGHLASYGSFERHHLGWGEAYVDFPGLFVMACGSALVLGVPTSAALSVVVPCVTAFSVLVVACIVLRLRRWPWAAVVAAAFLAVAFPEVFTNSHGVPGPVGSVLTMAIMLVFLMGDAWRRDGGVDVPRPAAMHALLLVLAVALAATHHLSLYFALISVGAAHLVRALMVSGGEPHRAAWGEYSILVLLGCATLFWLGLAPNFREEVMVDMFGLPAWAVMAAVWAGALAMLWAARWMGARRTRLPRLPYTGPFGLNLYIAAFVAGGVLVMAAVSVWGVPGTSIDPGPEILVYFLPLLLALTLTVGVSEVLLMRHGGHAVVAWLCAIAASFLFAAAIQSHVLVSYRHLPYIIDAAAVLIGLGAVNLRRISLPGGRRWDRLAGFAVAALVVMLALTAYPPKGVMTGFQEGTDERELAAAMWLRGGVPRPGAYPADDASGTVATDHRLSSIAFGVGGQMATWDSGGGLLYASTDAEARGALASIDTPRGSRPVVAALISEDLRTGAAGLQWEPARPVGDAAWDKFFEPPFVRLYDGGTAWVLGVDPSYLGG